MACMTSCGGDCTSIGPPSTVQIDTAPVVSELRERLTVVLCVNETCEKFDRFSRRLGFVEIDDPEIDDEGPVRVVLTISTDGGEIIFDGTTNTALRLVQPNGPGCGDKLTASLVATGESSLDRSTPP
jgi:hypothetical protein